MNDDHMAIWAHEVATSKLTREWESWVARVESLLGHDLDGNQDVDGYSMDESYSMWLTGLTPIEAYARIESSKRDVRRSNA